MDNQARRAPKKMDQTMVEAFAKRWGNHSSFKVGTLDRSGSSTFTISHFNGPVTYSSWSTKITHIEDCVQIFKAVQEELSQQQCFEDGPQNKL
jgi:myosin heavy subunit